MRLLDRLRRLVRKPEPFDPSRFDDPLANKTEWTPAKRGGANFRTHKMITNSTQRVSFVATLGLKLFCTLFIVLGAGIPAFIIYSKFDAIASFTDPEFIWPVVFGLVFIAAGGIILFVGLKPRVFDRTLGYYWRGYKGPGTMYNPDELAKFTRLHKIHAIQIIKERCQTRNGSYYSYELNLVLDDASRINVIDHGNSSNLTDDADKLAKFLNVPVWPAI